MFRLWIVLAILGAAVVGASVTVLESSKAEMLGIVFGGVLLQAGIVLFALGSGREKPRPRRRRLGVETGASQSPPAAAVSPRAAA